MFNRILSDLTLANDIADQAFSNVDGPAYNGDGSFVATLRALLLPRVGDDRVSFRTSSSDYRPSTIRDNGLKAVVDSAFPDFEPNRLIVHWAKAPDPEYRKALFDELDSDEKGFVKTYPNFHEMTNIRDFVSNVMNARFYTNETDRITVIVVESMTTRKWHYIQSFTPRYFKWYFENAPLTPEETHLLASLTKKSSDDYERIIEVFAGKYDLRSYLIKNVLGDLEMRARRRQLDETNRELDRIRQEIEDLESRYRDWIIRLDDTNIRRAGLIDILNGADGDSELVEYFETNKNLDPIRSEGSEFEFIVKTYMDSWDPDLFETLSKKAHSSLYEGYTVGRDIFRSVENRKKFINAIFSEDPLIRMKFCGYYRLDIRGHARSCRGYTYPRTYNDRLPNPHLQKFACLGTHESIINSCLRKGDVVGAVEQCITSCKSMNLTEPQTYQWHFEKLFSTDNKVIELPDHTSVSPVEAMNWLLEQEKKEEGHEDA